MKRLNYRALLALVLALVMLVSVAGSFADVERASSMNGQVTVMVEDPAGNYVQEPVQGTVINEDVTSTGGEQTLIGSDSAAASLNGPMFGGTPPAGSTLTVNGDVSCEAGGTSGGAKAVADVGNASLTVNGDVSATSVVETQAWNDAVTGESGISTSSDAYGVAVHSDGQNTEASVTVTGDVSADAKNDLGTDPNVINAEGVLVTACEGGTSEATVGGDVTVKSDSRAAGVDARGVWGDPLAGTSTIDIDVGGNVSATATYDACGVSLGNNGPDSKANTDWNVRIGGDVSAKTTEAEFIQSSGQQTWSNPTLAVGVDIESLNGDVKAEIGGNVTANGASHATGIDLIADNQGKIRLDAGGDVTVTAADGWGSGVSLSPHGEDATNGKGVIDATVGGNITVTASFNATGIDITGNNAKEDPVRDYSIVVNGDIKVNATDTDSYANGIDADNPNGIAEITVKGDITATGAGGNYGIDVSTWNKGEIKVETGSLNVTSTDWEAYGVYTSTNGTETDIRINGNIRASGDEMTFGLNSDNGNGGTSLNEIKGDVDVTGNGYAAGVQAFTKHEDDLAKITVSGDISATTTATSDDENNREAHGVDVNNYGGEISVSVVGDVTASGGEAKGLDISSGFNDKEEDLGAYTGPFPDGEIIRAEYDPETNTFYNVYYNKAEDYYYNELGRKWKMVPDDPLEGVTTVSVTGDVKSSCEGIRIDLENEKVETDVIVDGTVTAEKRNIVLAETTKIDNLTLTIWKVEADPNEAIVSRESCDETTGKVSYEQDEKAEKSIQYIIRIADDSAGMITTDAKQYEGYSVAKQDETVTLKLNIPAGQRVVNAFNGTDTKVKLLVDANGNYYLKVPRGGGVMLSLELEAIPDPQPSTETQTTNVINVTTKIAAMKAAAEASETTALKALTEDAVKNSDILSVLPDDIKSKLPAGVSKLVEAITLTLENYDSEMGAVTVKVQPTNRKYTKGEKATVVIALPDGIGGYTWFLIEGEGQEDGTLTLSLPAATAARLAGRTFVTMILE